MKTLTCTFTYVIYIRERESCNSEERGRRGAGRVGKGLRGCKPSHGGGVGNGIWEREQGRLVGDGKQGRIVLDRSPGRVGLATLSPKLFYITNST